MTFRRRTRAVFLSIALVASAFPSVACAERIKDVATIAGVRQNQLVGYGLVVGLDGTGDQTTQTPFTVQSTVNMLSSLGVSLPPGTNLQLKNVAAVLVTASLPAFARPGQQIDVTVSSLGNAKSLRGGTLINSQLKGSDGQVYAVAQGNVVVGGAGASGGGSKTQINHLSAGRVPGGATVERSVPVVLGEGDTIDIELNTTDFGTAKSIVEKINLIGGSGTAYAVDGRRISVKAPIDPDARVAFLGRLEAIDISSSTGAARVIVNSRTGSIVMNQAVTLSECAVAHGNLSVMISSTATVSQPNPLGQGETVVTEKTQIDIKQDGSAGNLIHLNSGVSLMQVVRALNRLGATPGDLVNILQAMKAAGALRAELEII